MKNTLVKKSILNIKTLAYKEFFKDFDNLPTSGKGR